VPSGRWRAADPASHTPVQSEDTTRARAGKPDPARRLPLGRGASPPPQGEARKTLRVPIDTIIRW